MSIGGSQWKLAPPDLYGCRLWLGKVDKDGYPIIWIGGRAFRAFRLAWEERHGPIPKDREIEHRCRRRSCMTDVHHTLVTRRVNEQLKKWSSRVAANICDLAHDAIYAQVTPEGGRVCRLCSGGSR